MNSRNSAFEFCFAEFVVCVCKNRNNSVKRFDFSVKTTAAPSESGNVMPQVSIDTFDCKSIIFVVYIPNVASRINDVYITQITVCAVFLYPRRRIDHCLDSLRRFIRGNIKTDDLSRFTADHRHYIRVFTGFCMRFAF